MKKLALIAVALLHVAALGAKQYWKPDGPNRIIWQVEQGQEHHDHIEMAGKKMAVVLRYGVNKDGRFEMNRSMIWPMLRTKPNDTHASLMRRFDWNPLDGVTVDNRSFDAGGETVKSILLNGTMVVESRYHDVLTIRRTYIPSTELPSLVEIYQITNATGRNVRVEIPAFTSAMNTAEETGVDGSYRIELRIRNAGYYNLAPGESVSFSATLSAYRKTEQSTVINAHDELHKRMQLVNEWTGNLVLETPDPVINQLFAFTKIRSCESIFETKGGPMHGPGGESYYAAIWTNDQAEYINPYFPFVGYRYGNASAMNAFEHFMRYMNPEWKPIPSSIIAEGDGYWNGAGDRGDAAMIAYGATRYALARGNKQEAERLWPLIEWCLEFNHRKLNDGGVVASDSDELEGRFPAGKANLCTSSLYYDALISAAHLAEDLKKGTAVARKYRKQAAELEKNMDNYFTANVEGFDTYAYYEGNDVLRAWICIPLTVGINKRAKGTIDALFSPRLWTENGLLTQAGSNTFWDRSTLYALRGVFMAGEIEKAMTFMKHYSATRLLGHHVPYPVEAWPEGGQRHLSAESALYGRIVTEGIFGIRPTGLRSFTLTPRLPGEWNEMSLKNIRAFESEFDIRITREGQDALRVTIEKGGKTLINRSIKNGATLNCKVP